MAAGFVLIDVAPTKEHEVYDELLQMPEIKELYPLFGEFDLIARLETDNYNKLGQFVSDNIRTLEGVIHTKTLACVVF